MASFLDFLLMKELLESLEGHTRDNEEAERKSNPENLLLLVDHEAWNEAQDSCKRDKLVAAMEITHPFDESCCRVRPLFIDLAKEFDSVPFFRVLTGPGQQLTIEQICHDVGQINQLPTILLLYYDAEDHIKRKSYQGERAIQEALKDGQLKRKFKEFIDERVKQKATDSPKAAEKEYSEKLNRMSRDLPQDELVRMGTSPDPTESVHLTKSMPPCIPENEKDGDEINKTDSEQNLKHHKQDTKKDCGDDMDMTKTTAAATVPSTPKNEIKLDASHIIHMSDIKVGERIGQGVFGVVYEAKWKEKHVAVKVCSGNLIENFPPEVAILAYLPPHPYVMMFFGLALSDDKISTLIVTELATHGSLFNYLHVKKEVPSADQRLAWALQVASGMAHLHTHNVIHRDLKSGNILLSLGKVAKVCDFGTARHLAQTTKQTNMAGTYRWMSPEVMEDVEAHINNKCDVFSYGMVLYEIFAGDIPYAGIPDAVVGGVVLDGKRPPVPNAVPQFLRPFLLCCWEYDSKKRPTFQDIVVAIQTGSYKNEN